VCIRLGSDDGSGQEKDKRSSHGGVAILVAQQLPMPPHGSGPFGRPLIRLELVGASG